MKPLECATSLSTVSVVSLLLERGARLEECNALHHAVCTRKSDQECFEMMEFLLRKGVDINGRSWKIKQEVPCRTTAGTVLMSAVKKQEAGIVELDMVDRVKWLLNHGADPNIADKGGKKPIEYAVDQRLIDVLDGAG
jgi:ankyrin repeat protein